MLMELLVWTIQGICGMALLFTILTIVASAVIGRAEIEFDDKGDDDGKDND